MRPVFNVTEYELTGVAVGMAAVTVFTPSVMTRRAWLLAVNFGAMAIRRATRALIPLPLSPAAVLTVALASSVAANDDDQGHLARIADLIISPGPIEVSHNQCEIEVITRPSDQCATEMSNTQIVTRINLSEVSDIEVSDFGRVTADFYFVPELRDAIEASNKAIRADTAHLAGQSGPARNIAWAEIAADRSKELFEQGFATTAYVDRCSGLRIQAFRFSEFEWLFFEAGSERRVRRALRKAHRQCTKD